MDTLIHYISPKSFDNGSTMCDLMLIDVVYTADWNKANCSECVYETLLVLGEIEDEDND